MTLFVAADIIFIPAQTFLYSYDNHIRKFLSIVSFSISGQTLEKYFKRGSNPLPAPYLLSSVCYTQQCVK